MARRVPPARSVRKRRLFSSRLNTPILEQGRRSLVLSSCMPLLPIGNGEHSRTSPFSDVSSPQVGKIEAPLQPPLPPSSLPISSLCFFFSPLAQVQNPAIVFSPHKPFRASGYSRSLSSIFSPRPHTVTRLIPFSDHRSTPNPPTFSPLFVREASPVGPIVFSLARVSGRSPLSFFFCLFFFFLFPAGIEPTNRTPPHGVSRCKEYRRFFFFFLFSFFARIEHLLYEGTK